MRAPLPVTHVLLALLALAAGACSGRDVAPPADAAAAPGDLGTPRSSDGATRVDATLADATQVDGTAGADGASDGGAACFVPSVGVSGTCATHAACQAHAGRAWTGSDCPGPSDITCCTRAPSVSDDPPVPIGWKPMTQASVTPAMTTWAVQILHAPVMYPMFSSTTRTFGALLVMARVEWHPPDFQNGVVHRGVTLYQHQ